MTSVHGLFFFYPITQEEITDIFNHFASVDVFTCQTLPDRLTVDVSRNLAFVCVDRMTSISTTCGQAHGRLMGFLRTDFLGVHGTSRLDTWQQWTSSIFSWMVCLIPLSKTCSFDWLGWNFYRRINLHCHETLYMKGGSLLFDRCITAYDGMVSGEERRTHWTN